MGKLQALQAQIGAWETRRQDAQTAINAAGAKAADGDVRGAEKDLSRASIELALAERALEALRGQLKPAEHDDLLDQAAALIDQAAVLDAEAAPLTAQVDDLLRQLRELTGCNWIHRGEPSHLRIKGQADALRMEAVRLRQRAQALEPQDTMEAYTWSFS